MLAGRGGDTTVEESANGGSRRTGAGGQATGNKGAEIEEGRTSHRSTGGGRAQPVAQSDTWGLDQAGGGSESIRPICPAWPPLDAIVVDRAVAEIGSTRSRTRWEGGSSAGDRGEATASATERGRVRRRANERRRRERAVINKKERKCFESSVRCFWRRKIHRRFSNLAGDVIQVVLSKCYFGCNLVPDLM